MINDFIVTYSNQEKHTIKAYSVQFKPGFVLFYDGDKTKAINASTVLEITWGVME